MRKVKKGQKALLIATSKSTSHKNLKENLKELTELARAAELHPVIRLSQNLKTIDPAFLIGAGKRKEIKALMETEPVDFIIFDHSLSGAQTRNLEKELKIFVLDRNQLILEIFAQRAKSFEGKLQVQLASLLDQMPRMVGAWLGSLSRQGGGTGAARRGPGEKAIETDRRRAKATIKQIRQKLNKVRQNRLQHRSARKKRKIPSFALVGYTNSGKSTLLNFLTKSQVETKDQPFMTLDPKTRKVFIPEIKQAVITDTVGFIRNLPHHLIEAFKATLEESEQADILIHVIDASSKQRNKEIAVVNELIEAFQWSNKPVIHAFNKTDLISNGTLYQVPLSPQWRPRVFISAKTGSGIPSLLEQMKESLNRLNEKIQLFFPKEKEHQIYKLHREVSVEKKESSSGGTLCYAWMNPKQIKTWGDYIIERP